PSWTRAKSTSSASTSSPSSSANASPLFSLAIAPSASNSSPPKPSPTPSSTSTTAPRLIPESLLFVVAGLLDPCSYRFLCCRCGASAPLVAQPSGCAPLTLLLLPSFGVVAELAPPYSVLACLQAMPNCPICRHQLQKPPEDVRDWFRCENCGTPLQVPPLFGRVLLWISTVL